MGAPQTTVIVPAKQWKQVLWRGVPFVTASYRFVVRPRFGGTGQVFVRWRWFSAGIPPYWEGSFVNEAEITLVASVYTSLEFYTDIETVVSVRPS